ncbi:alpha/beta hydrolase [Stenotrophomonas humi]
MKSTPPTNACSRATSTIASSSTTPRSRLECGALQGIIMNKRDAMSHQQVPDRGRRSVLKMAGFAAVASASPVFAQSPSSAAEADAVQLTQEWDKVFPRSNKVDHRKVVLRNRYGITLAADLYEPRNVEGKLPAIVVGGPFGAVKEQSSGLYAQTMAERGFVTLAFDPSYTGESGGEPRNVASPDINTEDFSAAVDFLGLQPNVDRERIGIIGICGWGGMALNAAAVDKRIKAIVASSMYDMTRVMSRGYNDSMTLEQRTQALEELGRQRWQDAEQGSPAYQPAYNELKGGEAQFLVDYHDYYRTQRGYHPRAVNSGNAWTITTPLSFMNMPLLTYIAEISPRPVLFIHGEKAHSRYFSETAYAAASQPKELAIIAGANHTDLYDRLDVIPFDQLTTFFTQHLAAK